MILDEMNGNVMAKQNQGSPPEENSVPYLSKSRIKKKWATLGIDDLDRPPEKEEDSTLNELYDDDTNGLGNE